MIADHFAHMNVSSRKELYSQKGYIMKIRVTVTVTGLVQGVSFRHSTRQAALQHRVTGWVRNRPDGAVQGCFEGEERDVMALVDWCRIGPNRSRVDEVTIEKGAFSGEFDVFEIKL
jgi:acylphosphatase